MARLLILSADSILPPGAVAVRQSLKDAWSELDQEDHAMFVELCRLRRQLHEVLKTAWRQDSES
eukprot:2917723-Amphidinium_carterae.1